MNGNMHKAGQRRRGDADRRRALLREPRGAARALGRAAGAATLLLAIAALDAGAGQSAATAADEGTSPPTRILARQMQPATGVAYYAYVKHRKPGESELAPCPEIPVGGSPAAGEYLMQIVLVPSEALLTNQPYFALPAHWGAIRAGLTYVEKDGTTKLQQRDPMVEPVAGSLSSWTLKVGPDDNIWGRDANDAHNFHSHALPFLMPLATKVGAAKDNDSKETQEVALLRALCGENGIKAVDQANVGAAQLYRLHRLLEAKDDQITALDALPWLRVFLDPGADPAAEAPDLAGLLALTQNDGGFVRSRYLQGKPSAAHALLFQAFRREAWAKLPASQRPEAPPQQRDLAAVALLLLLAVLAGGATLWIHLADPAWARRFKAAPRRKQRRDDADSALADLVWRPAPGQVSPETRRLDALEGTVAQVAEQLGALSRRLDSADAAAAQVREDAKQWTETRTRIDGLKDETRGLTDRTLRNFRILGILQSQVQRLEAAVESLRAASPLPVAPPEPPANPEPRAAAEHGGGLPAPAAEQRRDGAVAAAAAARMGLQARLEALDLFAERGWDALWADLESAQPHVFLDQLVSLYLPENLDERVHEVIDEWLADSFDGRAQLIRPRPGAPLNPAEHRSIATVPRDRGAFNVVSALVRAGVKYDGQVVREAVVIRVA
jgi:hypothetical protein